MSIRKHVGQTALAAAAIGLVSVTAYAQPANAESMTDHLGQVAQVQQTAAPVWTGQNALPTSQINAGGHSSTLTTAGDHEGWRHSLYTGWRHH